jgi:hypothetical protein
MMRHSFIGVALVCLVLFDLDTVTSAVVKKSVAAQSHHVDYKEDYDPVEKQHEAKKEVKQEVKEKVEKEVKEEEENIDEELEDIELMKTLTQVKNYLIGHRGAGNTCTLNGVTTPCVQGSCAPIGSTGSTYCECLPSYTGLCCKTQCTTPRRCRLMEQNNDCF